MGSPFVHLSSSSKIREEDLLHFSVRLALRNGWLSSATLTVELASASLGTHRAAAPCTEAQGGLALLAHRVGMKERCPCGDRGGKESGKALTC